MLPKTSEPLTGIRGNRSNDSIFERVLSDLIFLNAHSMCAAQFSKTYRNKMPVPLPGRAFCFLKCPAGLTSDFLRQECIKLWGGQPMTTGIPAQATENAERFYTMVKSLNNFDKAEVKGVIDTLLSPTPADNCSV